VCVRVRACVCIMLTNETFLGV